MFPLVCREDTTEARLGGGSAAGVKAVEIGGCVEASTVSVAVIV